MLNFIKKLFGLNPETPTEETKVTPDAPVVATSTADTGEVTKPKPQRTRSRKGRYIPDDPSTPHNEAWKGGQSPKKPQANKPKPQGKPKSTPKPTKLGPK